MPKTDNIPEIDPYRAHPILTFCLIYVPWMLMCNDGKFCDFDECMLIRARYVPTESFLREELLFLAIFPSLTQSTNHTVRGVTNFFAHSSTI